MLTTVDIIPDLRSERFPGSATNLTSNKTWNHSLLWVREQTKWLLFVESASIDAPQNFNLSIPTRKPFASTWTCQKTSQALLAVFILSSLRPSTCRYVFWNANCRVCDALSFDRRTWNDLGNVAMNCASFGSCAKSHFRSNLLIYTVSSRNSSPFCSHRLTKLMSFSESSCSTRYANSSNGQPRAKSNQLSWGTPSRRSTSSHSVAVNKWTSK
jgi:hypothetical protein